MGVLHDLSIAFSLIITAKLKKVVSIQDSSLLQTEKTGDGGFFERHGKKGFTVS